MVLSECPAANHVFDSRSIRICIVSSRKSCYGALALSNNVCIYIFHLVPAKSDVSYIILDVVDSRVSFLSDCHICSFLDFYLNTVSLVSQHCRYSIKIVLNSFWK